MSPAGQIRAQIAYVRGRYAYAYRFPLVMIDVTRQVLLAIAPGGRAQPGRLSRARCGDRARL
jgi:hypothetical protein